MKKHRFWAIGLVAVLILTNVCGCAVPDTVNEDCPLQSPCINENDANDNETLNIAESFLDKKGGEIICSYEYELDSEHKAEILCVLEAGIKKILIFINEADGNTVQELGKYPYIGFLHSFVGLKYQDINDDGLDDITIEYEFMTGIGAEGSIPRMEEIQFLRQEDGSFVLID